MLVNFTTNNLAADHHDFQNRGSLLMHDLKPFGSLLWAVLLVVAATFGFNGCGNVNDVVVPNDAPVANAGPDLGSLISGTFITLNGSASTDPNGDPLTYSWTLLTKPAGSAAVLANPTSVTPTFTVDLAGIYVVQLIVNDGTQSSTPNTVNIYTVVRITTNRLLEGRRNRPYADTLEASGGIIPYTWSVTPALPAGLTLDPATGVISGTPTTLSDINHDFTVRDSTNQTTTKELRLRIRK
jgi:Putative Ig domain/PKD domain